MIVFRRIFTALVLVVALTGMACPADAAPRRVLLSGHVAWTPTLLPNLGGWYKADAGTFSDASCSIPAVAAGPLGCWKDQSPSGANLTLITTAPIYNTGVLNGLPVVTAPNAGKMSSGTFALGGNVVSVFMVIRSTGVGGGSSRTIAFGVGGSDTGASAFIAAYFPSQTTPTTFNVANKSSATIVASSWNELGTIFDGTNNIFYLNNVPQTPVAATPTFAATGNLFLFISASGANLFAGDVAEIIICKGALGASDRANIHAYFARKWGV